MDIFKLKIYEINETEALAKADYEADRLFGWAETEGYKKLKPEQLAQQLEEFHALIDKDGFVKTLKDELTNMPNDCRVVFVYKPTYSVLAVYSYAAVVRPELFEEGSYRKDLQKLMAAATKRNLLDHGYNAQVGKLHNLLLLTQAGIATTIKQYPELCPAFTELIKRELDYVKKDVKKNNENFTVAGFGLVRVNLLAQRIVEALKARTAILFILPIQLEQRVFKKLTNEATRLGRATVKAEGMDQTNINLPAGRLFAVKPEAVDKLLLELKKPYTLVRVIADCKGELVEAMLVKKKEMV